MVKYISDAPQVSTVWGRRKDGVEFDAPAYVDGYQLQRLGVATSESDPGVAPAPVTGFTLTPGDGVTMIAWAASPDIVPPVENYRIESSLDGVNFTPLVLVPTTSYTHRGVINGETYYYRVAAINAIGVGAFTSIQSATPMDNSPPLELPGAVSGMVAMAGNSSVTLMWNAPVSTGTGSLINYVIERRTGAGTYVALTTINAVVESYVDATAVNGQSYTYRVAAQNGVGVGPFEESESVTPMAGPETHVFVVMGQSNSTSLSNWDNGQGFPEGVRQLERYATPLTGTSLVDLNDKPVAEQMLIPATTPLHSHTGKVNNGFGFTLQFVIEYAQANPEVDIVIVPCGHGSTGFRDENGVPGRWNRGQDLYEDTKNRINHLFTIYPDFTLKGILFHQGERDSSTVDDAAAHIGLVRQMRSDLISEVAVWTEETPFIVGGMVPSFVQDSATRQTVQDNLEMLPQTVAYTAYADPNSPTVLGGDGGNGAAHFNPMGYRGMGSRYLTAYNEALLNVPAVPEAITGFIAAPNNGRVILSWTIPEPTLMNPITNFIIERRVSGGNFVQIMTVEGSTSSYVDFGVTNEVTYDYRVAAVNAVGTGPYAEFSDVTPTGVAVPLIDQARSYALFGSDNQATGSTITAIQGPGLTLAGSLTYEDGYVTLPNNPNTGIDTEFLQTIDSTMIVVARVFDSGNSMIMGNFASDIEPRQTLFKVSDGFRHNFIADVPGNNKRLDTVIQGESVFKFFAVTQSATDRTIYIRDSETPVVVSDTIINEVNSINSIALGPFYWGSASGWQNPWDAAAELCFDRVLTEEELGELYDTLVTTLAERNVTLGEVIVTPVAPDAPTEFTATAGDGQALLSWVAPIQIGTSPLTGYLIERNVNNGGYGIVATVNPGTTIYIDNQITNGETYRYRIIARSAAGDSDFVISDPVIPIPESNTPGVEMGSAGHYLMGNDGRSGSEPDEIAGLAGEPISPTGSLAWRDGYVSLGFAPNTGIDTQFVQGNDNTMIIVARVPNDGDKVLIGNWSGDQPRQSLQHEQDGFRHRFVNSVGGGAQLHIGGASGDGEWKFIAVTQSSTTGTLYVRGSGAAQTGSENFTNDLNTLNTIALGPLRSSEENFANPFDVAEVMIFNQVLTSQELDDIYDRSVQRLAPRGIALGATAPEPDADLEPRALGHWLVGSDDPSYAGLAGPDLITAGQITGRNGHVTLPLAVESGFDIGFPDRLVSTMILVARVPDAGNKFLFGNWGNTNPKQAVFHTGAGFRHNFFHTNGTSDVFGPGLLGEGVFKFVALTRTATERAFYFHDGTTPNYIAEIESIVNDVDSVLNLAVGPFYPNTLGWNAQFDVAEIMFFDEALTEQELGEVYARTAARMTARGITIGT